MSGKTTTSSNQGFSTTVEKYIDVVPEPTQGKNNQANSATPVKVAIFASGAGSNAQRIIDFFRVSKLLKISMIVCNKPGAGVLSIAFKEQIPSLLIDKEKFFRGNAYADELRTAGIEFIVLAGFLWKIPTLLIAAYPNRIVNIHPALLPAHGGKGMYGVHVHEAVIAAGEKETGITIHYVDEQYDHGNTIFQANCAVLPGDTALELSKRVLQLEHEHFPKVIQEVILNLSDWHQPGGF